MSSAMSCIRVCQADCSVAHESQLRTRALPLIAWSTPFYSTSWTKGSLPGPPHSTGEAGPRAHSSHFVGKSYGASVASSTEKTACHSFISVAEIKCPDKKQLAGVVLLRFTDYSPPLRESQGRTVKQLVTSQPQPGTGSKECMDAHLFVSTQLYYPSLFLLLLVCFVF